jgi:Flp pilus assembly pilin Flp
MNTTLRRRFGRRLADDQGAATAEYAITILAAVGFASLLVALLKGDEVKSMLSDLVHRALAGG